MTETPPSAGTDRHDDAHDTGTRGTGTARVGDPRGDEQPDVEDPQREHEADGGVSAHRTGSAKAAENRANEPPA